MDLDVMGTNIFALPLVTTKCTPSLKKHTKFLICVKYEPISIKIGRHVPK